MKIGELKAYSGVPVKNYQKYPPDLDVKVPNQHRELGRRRDRQGGRVRGK